jgi:hypothetical protein
MVSFDIWGEVTKAFFDLFINHNGFIGLIGFGLSFWILHFAILRHYLAILNEQRDIENSCKRGLHKKLLRLCNPKVYTIYGLTALCLALVSFTYYLCAVYNDSGHKVLVHVLGTTSPTEYVSNLNPIVKKGKYASIACTPSVFGNAMGHYDEAECLDFITEMQLNHNILADIHALHTIAKIPRTSLITIEQNNKVVSDTLLALDAKKKENSAMVKLQRHLVTAATQ